MGLLKKIQKTVGHSEKVLQGILSSYLGFNPQAKQLILKQKTVTFLCHQAEAKIAKLRSLVTDDNEGLIATIKHENIDIKLHFTPELITMKEDCIEGQLRLLKQPDIQIDSWIYTPLIVGWKIFLGGQIPQNVLPENIKIEGDTIYYIWPRNEVKLLEVLCGTMEPGSTLVTNLKQGELIIEGALAKLTEGIALNWNDLNLLELMSILKLKS